LSSLFLRLNDKSIIYILRWVHKLFFTFFEKVMKLNKFIQWLIIIWVYAQIQLFCNIIIFLFTRRVCKIISQDRTTTYIFNWSIIFINLAFFYYYLFNSFLLKSFIFILNIFIRLFFWYPFLYLLFLNLINFFFVRWI
jgi:hypothetical protein